MPTATKPRTNRYAGACSLCGKTVAAGAGELGPKVAGRWSVVHVAGACIAPAPQQTYYERILTEAGLDIKQAEVILGNENEWWDGEATLQYGAIVAMRKALGYDYSEAAAKLAEAEAFEASFYA